MFSWEYPPIVEGGLGRHVRGLSEQLVAQGVELHVISRGPEATVDEEREGVIVHRVAQPAFPRDIGAFLRWVAGMNREMSALADGLAAELDVDLVHSHDWLVSDAALACARGLERPWVVTVHATEHGRHQGWVQTHPQSAIHRAERAMARQADHLITCSRYMRAHVADVFGVPRQRITALRNGIDLGPTADDAATGPGGRVAAATEAGSRIDARGARAELAGPDELLVLLVGRLVHEKGFHLALDSLAPLVHARGPARPGVRFAVVGAGTAEQDLRRQVRRLRLESAGTFLGWVGDERLRKLYRAADVCVVPSLYEPFGIVALEAMAGGCPCIVADTGGLREIVPAGERVGLRVPPDDAVALRDALARLLGDARLRARLAADARGHLATFDWPRVAASTRQVYAQMLAQVPARA
jgi:glycogen(starch) synthase